MGKRTAQSKMIRSRASEFNSLYFYDRKIKFLFCFTNISNVQTKSSCYSDTLPIVLKQMHNKAAVVGQLASRDAHLQFTAKLNQGTRPALAPRISQISCATALLTIPSVKRLSTKPSPPCANHHVDECDVRCIIEPNVFPIRPEDARLVAGFQSFRSSAGRRRSIIWP